MIPTPAAFTSYQRAAQAIDELLRNDFDRLLASEAAILDETPSEPFDEKLKRWEREIREGKAGGLIWESGGSRRGRMAA